MDQEAPVSHGPGGSRPAWRQAPVASGQMFGMRREPPPEPPGTGRDDCDGSLLRVVHQTGAYLRRSCSPVLKLEALLTVGQKQATELTSPDGRLRHRTSQVKAWHPILPRATSRQPA